MDVTVDTASPPSPASLADGGGRGSAPTASAPAGPAASALDSTRIGRALRELTGSVWAPVVGRAGAILAGMLALGGIGAVSTLAGAGVVVHLPSPPDTAAALVVGSVWLPTDHERAAAMVAPIPASGSAPAPGAAPEPGPAAGVTADGKVILNTATAEQLTKLPRVGPKRAQAILALRQKLGHFRSATELLRVRGIGRKTLRVLLPLFVLDPPSAAPGSDTAKKKEGRVP